MDEHKSFRRPKRYSASIDGIISSGRQLGSLDSGPRRDSQVVNLSEQASRQDGFYPTRSSGASLGFSPAADEAALLDEPIILDDLPQTPKKKRRFSIKRIPFWSSASRVKKAAILVAVLVLAVTGYFGIKLYITEHHLFHGGGRAPALSANVDPSQLKGEGDGRINIMLLGIGGPGHDGPDLTDSILLVSIDPVNNKMALLSLPRDLWVKIPGDGYQKVNAAYAYGKEGSSAKTLAGQEKDGLSLFDQTVEPVLGIPIHYHVVVDFKAFQQAVNAVGGVDANVPPNLTAYEDFWVEGTSQHYLLNVPAGQQHFDGTKALYYARERHNDSDFVRAQRQRLLLGALRDKVLSLGTFSNPVKVSSLLSSLGDNVYSDFSLNDITRLYQIVKKIPSSSINSLDLVTPPHDYLTTGNMNGLSIVQPKAGLFDYTDIQSYVRNAMRDSFLAKENASIAVYNATDIAGMASAKATLLKSYGYTITTVDNTKAVSNPESTVVVDLTNGKDKYTRHYLEERFGVTAVTSVPGWSGINPPAGTNFVIILGRNAANSN